MSESELEDLAQDINRNGQDQPILLLNNFILDGRNRYLACQRVGIQPHFRALPTDTDPLKLVKSLNIFRRHLTTSQRAMLAADLATLADGQKPGAQICAGGTANPQDQTQTSVADALRVSRRSVQAARSVKTNAIKPIIQAVKAGELSVSRAAQIAELSKSEQRQIVDSNFAYSSTVNAPTPSPCCDHVRLKTVLQARTSNYCQAKKSKTAYTGRHPTDWDLVARELSAIIEETLKPK